MNAFIYFLPGLIGGAVFWLAVGFAARWLYNRWKQTIGGMYDDGAAVIADQGDDWAPAPIPWPGNFIEKQAANDEARPAWHSAVSVEIVTRGE